MWFGSYMFEGWVLWYFKDNFLLLILLIPRALDGNIWNNSVAMVVPKSQPGDAIKFRGGNDTWWMNAQFLSAAKLSLVTLSRPISQLGWQRYKVLWGFFSYFVMGLLLKQHILRRVEQTCLTAFPLSGEIMLISTFCNGMLDAFGNQENIWNELRSGNQAAIWRSVATESKVFMWVIWNQTLNLLLLGGSCSV